MKAAEVAELVKYYRSFRAPKGISLEVDEGEIFRLMSPNGAGKTTALRSTATLREMTSGSRTVILNN